MSRSLAATAAVPFLDRGHLDGDVDGPFLQLPERIESLQALIGGRRIGFLGVDLEGLELKTLTCDRAVDHSSGLANRSRISGLPPTGENQTASVGAADTVEIPPGTDAHPSNVSTEAINILDELYDEQTSMRTSSGCRVRQRASTAIRRVLDINGFRRFFPRLAKSTPFAVFAFTYTHARASLCSRAATGSAPDFFWRMVSASERCRQPQSSGGRSLSGLVRKTDRVTRSQGSSHSFVRSAYGPFLRPGQGSRRRRAQRWPEPALGQRSEGQPSG
jgi:hypothetical protein